jgi:hypothetical protein
LRSQQLDELLILFRRRLAAVLLPRDDELLERCARRLDHGESCVARAGQLSRGLDDPLQNAVERERPT